MEKVLQILSASLAPITAISAIIIAWRGHMLERSKFRHLLYEKRLAIYNSSMLYLANFIRNGEVSDEELMKFLQETNQAYFLLGDDIATYLTDLYKKGVELRTTIKVRTQRPSISDDELKRLCDKEEKLLLWFGEQMTECRKKFIEQLMLK